VLIFFIEYVRPVQVVASGKVMVAAETPVNAIALSVDVAVVLEVTER